MNPMQASPATRFRVGVFSVLGLVLIGAVTVFVNDRPFWWRSCQLVNINIEDATGLKTKSPVRSLGLQIGYLESVELFETYVKLGICITAPVDVLSSTRAYIRGEGFLGDKFVELKPVKYIGRHRINSDVKPEVKPEPVQEPKPKPSQTSDLWKPFQTFNFGIAEAHAEEPSGGREIPVGQKTQDVQHLVEQVDGLVGEMKNVANNLKDSINPEQLRNTVTQLNRALENASRTLAPEGSLNTTAQRTLAKLEDSIEQLRDQLTRMNRGEGSVGMLLNDPSYADEIREALRKVNSLLGKADQMRLEINISGDYMGAYKDSRGMVQLSIWPKKERFYRIGLATEPRGKVTETRTETSVNGGPVVKEVKFVTEPSQLLFTAMIGKMFTRRLEGSVGFTHNDGTLHLGYFFGPAGNENFFQIQNDVYGRSGVGIDDRFAVVSYPFVGKVDSASTWAFDSFYVRAGLESFRKQAGKANYFIGAGLSFDDEDIKLLFAFR